MVHKGSSSSPRCPRILLSIHKFQHRLYYRVSLKLAYIAVDRNEMTLLAIQNSSSDQCEFWRWVRYVRLQHSATVLWGKAAAWAANRAMAAAARVEMVKRMLLIMNANMLDDSSRQSKREGRRMLVACWVEQPPTLLDLKSGKNAYI